MVLELLLEAGCSLQKDVLLLQQLFVQLLYGVLVDLVLLYQLVDAPGIDLSHFFDLVQAGDLLGYLHLKLGPL